MASAQGLNVRQHRRLSVGSPRGPRRKRVTAYLLQGSLLGGEGQCRRNFSASWTVTPQEVPGHRQTGFWQRTSALPPEPAWCVE